MPSRRYVGAVEAAFGWNVDYAQLTKAVCSRLQPARCGVSVLAWTRLGRGADRDKRQFRLGEHQHVLHETIRCTPAIEIGATDHIWTIGELVAEALGGEEVSRPEPPKPINALRPATRL